MQTTNSEDAELVDRAARYDDRAAFAQLIVRHRGTALRVAYVATGDEETAREIVQEATLQAFLSLAQLRQPERFGAWFVGIVRNVCRSYRRGRGGAPLSWDHPAIAPRLPVLPDSAQVAEVQADRQAIRCAIETLSAAQRDAAMLFYLEQQSVDAIAVALGATAGAVRVRLHEARKRLRQTLAAHFPEHGIATVNPSPVLSRPRRSEKTMSDDKAGIVPVTIVPVTDIYGGDLSPETAAMVETPLASEAHARRFLLSAITSLPPHFKSGLFLVDEAQAWALSVPVGQSGGCTILAALLREENGSIAPYELMRQMLEQMEAAIESVHLDALEDRLYFADIRLRTPTGAKTLRARPADALALAAHLGTPIAVAATVMEREAWPLTDAQATVRDLLSGDRETAAVSPFLVRLMDDYLAANLRYRHDDTLTVTLSVRPHSHFPFAPRLWEHRHWRRMNSMVEIPTPLPLALLPVITAHIKRLAGLDISVTGTAQVRETTVLYRGVPTPMRVSTTPNGNHETIEFHFPLIPPPDENLIGNVVAKNL